MIALEGQVALVTGASRGVGLGIARALADAGAVVYATARTIDVAELPDGILRIVCDHLRDEQVANAFQRILDQRGRVDILVNSAWGGYERMVESGRFTWSDPFWAQPTWRWAAMMDVGVRAAFVAAQIAARSMVQVQRGLIVNLSSWAAQKWLGNVLYGMSKSAVDKMTHDMAHELAPYRVTAVSLYPGLVRTEAVVASGAFDLSNSESPEFSGRAIAALAADPKVNRWNGKVLVAAELATLYGFTDIDGRQPTALTVQTV